MALSVIQTDFGNDFTSFEKSLFPTIYGKKNFLPFTADFILGETEIGAVEFENS